MLISLTEAENFNLRDAGRWNKKRKKKGLRKERKKQITAMARGGRLGKKAKQES